MSTIETKPYVCISIQSTAQCKYYNYPRGWEIVIDRLKERGYDVWCIDKHSSFGNTVMNYIPRNAIDRTGMSLEETMQALQNCKLFIGISSGLSWLAWAMKKHVILVSGITNPEFEFTENCTRIINTEVCHGCFNNPNFTFDAGNWMWCPMHKDSERQFECTKQIDPKNIMQAVYSYLEKL